MLRAIRLELEKPSQPESDLHVTLSGDVIVFRRPRAQVARLGWRDLREVWLETREAASGPADPVWILKGAGGACEVPHGATGISELLGRLRTLPAFDTQSVITALTSATSGRFLCWRRGQS